MDSNATMVKHINYMRKYSYFHIYNIEKIRKYLDRICMEQLVHTFIISRVDYCNSLLRGLPSNVVQIFQRIQSVAARIVTGSKN